MLICAMLDVVPLVIWQKTTTVKHLSKHKTTTNENIVENQVRVGATGGIEAVVKAINTHIDNDDVCEFGCGALWNVTVNNGKNN